MSIQPSLSGNGGDRTLLLVQDAQTCEQLAPAFAARGFHVEVAHTAGEALELASRHPAHYAIVALKLPDASGLRLLSELLAIVPAMRIVVLTGYPSIPTAVEAIKLGAVYYLPKPATTDQLIRALQRDHGDAATPINGRPMSMNRIAWEYMSHVLQENHGNISATARALAIHRRTLQRKLRKRPAQA